MKEQHLTAADRRVVEVLLRKHCTKFEIARELGVDKSTVCREVTQRSTPAGYFAKIAQIDYETKRKHCGKKRKLSDSRLQNYVLNKLYLGWSPQQISGRMKYEDNCDYVCMETIYSFVYSDNYCKTEKVFQYLRFGKRRRTKHYARNTHKERIPNRVSIHERPQVVAKRIEYGHFEGDSVIYPNLSAINTMNELFTGLVFFTKLERRTAELTAEAMMKVLKDNDGKTVTIDNGLEFSQHERLTASLGVKVYFCDPYCSNQRGSNENTNGLLRRYLPKKVSISDLTQEELDDIAFELNCRPRKRLGYKTPFEVYEQCVVNLQKGLSVAVESRI